MVGDTLTPLNAKILRNSNPVDLAGLTVKMQIESEAGVSLLAETATGVTAHPTQTFTAATTDIITCNGHGVSQDDQLILSNSGGALPAGLATATRYFARDVTPNTFTLAASPGAAVVDVTGTGTGTHSFYVVGSVQYDFSTVAAATVGRYRAWFTVYSGSEFDTYPPNRDGIPIEVCSYGN